MMMTLLHFLLLTVTYILHLCITAASSLEPNTSDITHVKVYHFILPHWGESENSVQQCSHMDKIKCEWTYSHEVHALKQLINETHSISDRPQPITVTVYNVHSWWEKFRSHSISQHACDLNTNFAMVESEESFVRYSHIFKPSFHQFDGNSTTSPSSSLQRVYAHAFLNKTIPFMETPHNFTYLIKAASYVASDCHARDGANSRRDWYVQQLRYAGIRVDGLARCMRSNVGPEGVSLSNSHDSRYNLVLKRDVISRFMFNLAFENSIESGYVTEKPFDALAAGTVPIYLGDSHHFRSMLPHPKAAIFASDYDNMTMLAYYLEYLMANETAYEEHRSWRYHFNYTKHISDKPLLQNTWFCRICQWAAEKAVLIPTEERWNVRLGTAC